MSKKKIQADAKALQKARREEKARRAELAKKKAKRIKIMVICCCSLAAAALVTFAVLAAVSQSGAETYSADGQTIRLFDDGKFTATLSHNERKSGTYTKSGTTITFTSGSQVVTTTIQSNELHLPSEWASACGHGHSAVLRKT
jgi:ABC-type Fe3+ transport system permease subunit